MERLEEQGLILGYQADVDVEQLDDLSLYYVSITIKNYSAEVVRKIEALITGNPYIVSADCLFASAWLSRLWACCTNCSAADSVAFAAATAAALDLAAATA